MDNNIRTVGFRNKTRECRIYNGGSDILFSKLQMRFTLLFYRADYDTKNNLTACCTIIFANSANRHFVF